MKDIKWKRSAEKKNIKAAASFLRLLLSEKETRKAVAAMRKNRERTEKFRAKDIMRASGLAPAEETDAEVQDEMKDIKAGKKIPPVLLVKKDEKLYIGDGFHRVCAAYYLDMEAEVCAVIVEL